VLGWAGVKKERGFAHGGRHGNCRRILMRQAGAPAERVRAN
jgi:hypothetical protein